MKNLLISFLLFFCTIYYTTAFSSDLKIVTTIKPLHSLVTSVTDGVLKPFLLTYTSSVHDQILKPSDISNLESSDIIFYIDDNLETFVNTFAKKGKKLVQLSNVVKLLPIRSHLFSKNLITVKNEKDLHIWLSPENAKNMILFISKTLSYIDKKNSYKYNQNAMKAIEKINQEIKKNMKILNNFKNKKYIVIHDAYQYFEKFFTLNYPSAILSIEEDSYIGIKSLIKLKKIIKQEKIKCIFSSLQEEKIKSKSFPDGIKIIFLDPIGLDIEPGKDLYLIMINKIIQDFTSCFSSSIL